MQPRFLSNLVLLLGLNLLVKPFYLLVVEAEIQNRVGAHAFGTYFALISFSFILNIIPDLGITNWNTRHIARNSQLLQKHFGYIFTLRLCLSALFIVVCLVCGFVLNYRGTEMAILAILALSQVLASLLLFLRSNLAGLHRFREDSLLSVLDRLLLAAAMSLLLWTGLGGDRFDIRWLVWGQAGAYAAACAVAMFMVMRHAGRLRLSWDPVFFRAVLKESSPYALLIFFSAVAYRLDSVMLERWRSPHDSGIYAMAFRFYEAFNMMAYLFASLLLPMYSRMLKKDEDTGPLMSQAFRLLFSGALVVCSIAWFKSGYVLSLFYDHSIAEARPSFHLLMAGVLLFSLQYIFGSLLTAKGALKSLLWTAFTGMVLNAVLNTLLIPAMGPEGAAIANVATQGLVVTVQVWLVRRKVNRTPVITPRLAAFTLLLLLFSWLITRSALSDLVACLCILLTGIVLAFVTRMVNPARLAAAMRREDD